MSATLVLQSHRQPLPQVWIQACLDSVSHWARRQGFDYRFVDDELLGCLPAQLLAKTRRQPVIATDLARLRYLQRALNGTYDSVIWCDADFLIFDPVNFQLPSDQFALGREVWVQFDKQQVLRAYRKVHNAFLLFRRGNCFLDFYADTAERLLRLNQGPIPPQFLGPKFLTALHNIAYCPVHESAGMLSPLVLRDLLAGGGPALTLFHETSNCPIAAANLSASLTATAGLTESQMATAIQMLFAGAFYPSSGSGKLKS